jgi:enolase-phosphatase E1
MMRGILLDVEGTTSAIAFVYDVLFPFARQHLGPFLADRWTTPAVQAGVQQLQADVQTPLPTPTEATAAALRLMDGDVKATGLKTLQGLVWAEGYAAGTLRSHLFDDVFPALARWHAAGLDVRIFSSGSVTAQRVFFAHTLAGDLSGYLCGHYDTTTGPKKEPSSYSRIVADMGLPPAAVLFLSDVVAELDAARSAGLATALVVRPGNAPVTPGHAHRTLTTFAEEPTN